MAEKTVTELCQEYIATEKEAERVLKEERDAVQASRLWSKGEKILRELPSAKRE